jgi:hypothetical protein
LNASAEKIDFTLPTIPECTAWRKVHDTSVAMDGNEVVPAGSRLPALARSVLVFSGEGPRAS